MIAGCAQHPIAAHHPIDAHGTERRCQGFDLLPNSGGARWQYDTGQFLAVLRGIGLRQVEFSANQTAQTLVAIVTDAANGAHDAGHGCFKRQQSV